MEMYFVSLEIFDKNKNQKVIEGDEKSAGRPAKDDSQKSDKTIANNESMS